MVNKLITKIKNTITKNKNLYPLEDDEFMFSTKEIEDLTEQNKQKLENLKKGTEKKKTISFTAVSKKLNGILDEPKEFFDSLTEQEFKELLDEFGFEYVDIRKDE